MKHDGTTSSTLESQELGVATFDATTGKSASFEVSVPDDALSVSIYVSQAQGHDYYLVTDVLGPDGTVWVASSNLPIRDLVTSGGLGSAEINSRNRSTFFVAGSNSLMIPNNPGVQLNAGTWRFKVLGVVNDNTASASAEHPQVEVLIKRGPSLDAGTRGHLSLAIFATGSDAITAESAAGNASYQSIADTLRQVFGSARIAVSIDSISDMDASLSSVDFDTFAGVFLATSGAAAVNLVLVNDLRLQTGPAAGFSGGLPGRPFVSGRPFAAVIVSSNDTSSTERRPPPGIAAAHEISHFLGLPHTFEGLFPAAESDFDQFDDTAKDYSMNLMDAGANPYPVQSTVLTPLQIETLLRSPSVTLTR